MSGIYIPNMEMPKGCHICILCNMGDNLSDDWFCEALHGERLEAKNKTGIRRGDCPLVEVPTHGRLGDLDALEKLVFERKEKARDRGDWGVADGYMYAKELVDDAPTIIEASKERE